MIKSYPNPAAFEQALKARVKREARASGVDAHWSPETMEWNE